MTTTDGFLPWLVYAQLGYALWQWVRGWAMVRLICKLPAWALFYRPRKKKVVLVNEVYEDLEHGHSQGGGGGGGGANAAAEIAAASLNLSLGEARNGIEIVSKEGYWVKARLVQEGEYMIAHQAQIARLWTTDMEGQDFVAADGEEIHGGGLCIARKLSRRSTLLRIAAGYKTAAADAAMAVVYGPPDMETAAGEAPLLAFLAALPLFFQAQGYGRVSLWLSLAILGLDLLRRPLFRLYDAAFDHISAFLMLRCFQQRPWLHRSLSIFSRRWAYGDALKQSVYSAKGCGFLLHTAAVFQREGDYELTFGYGDYQGSFPTPEDQHFVICHRRIYALPIAPRMGSYCKVLCNVDAIVAGRPPPEDLHVPLRHRHRHRH